MPIKYDNFDYKKLNTLIDFEQSKTIIVNSQTDVDGKITTLSSFKNIMKFDNIQVKQNVHIVQEMSEPIRETIRLYPFEDLELETQY